MVELEKTQIGESVLIQGECIEVLKYLIEKGVKVQAIIDDLPYGTTECIWDNVISFPIMWELIHQIAPKAPIVLFGKEPFTSKLVCSNISEYREKIEWLKNRSGSGMKATQAHIDVLEDIVVFAERAKYTYNPQKWLVAEKEFLTQRKTFKETEVGNNVYSKMTRTRKPDDGTRNPINILSCAVPFTPSKTKEYNNPNVDLRYHPTQKPIELMEYLVETYSNEGDIVLDFTAGSFTTGVACQNKGRKFIGIEREKEYYAIGVERMRCNRERLEAYKDFYI